MSDQLAKDLETLENLNRMANQETLPAVEDAKIGTPVEEVEKAIADYNKPKVVKRSATKKVIRQEIVPDWLKQQNEAQYQSQTQTTLSNQVEEPTPDWLKQQNELQYQNETTTVEEPTQTKSVEDIIREFSFAPFNTIMFQLEQHGYERTTDLINKVMQFKEPTF